ncbi:MAG: helix-turn-helix transcriptional regulator [Alphaproteobacteria bacterium]|nr:helix-turn-helix transcriptional regulator [Alphaproteobacteria bacterium]
MKKMMEFIRNAPGLWIAKDKNSIYQGLSKEFLHMLGWKNMDQVAGKTDYDIPCRVSEFANTFIKQDKQTVDSDKKLLTLEIMPFASGWRSVLVERRARIDEKGSAAGVLLQAIDVSDSAIFKKCLLLNASDQKIVDTANKIASYILSVEHSPLPLTKQQECCLFLLIRGKCPKKIAGILNISVRTVETHIEAMRYKLGCFSKAQLIEKAIDCGYFYYIPKDMQYSLS